MKGVILDRDSLGDDVDLAPIIDCFTDIEIHGSTQAADVALRIEHAEIILTNKIRLGREELQHCRNLKMINVMATGTNNIDLEYCTQNSIAVCNARGYSTPSVAQHTFSLMLALSTNLIAYDRDVKKGAWQRSHVFCLLDHPIQELAGKTLGILGYGELGQAVAGIARAFGMTVLIAKRPGSTELGEHDRVEWTDLLPQADYLSLHCPLTPENKEIVDSCALGLMKSTAFLVNTARGGLVNSEDLISALRSCQIGGAAIDVLNTEPATMDELLLKGDIPNLIVTPHNAWGARESRERLIIQMEENILSYGKNEFPRSVLTA
jgi:glycerate dehydrogenase